MKLQEILTSPYEYKLSYFEDGEAQARFETTDEHQVEVLIMSCTL